jgi:hypothetical protein
MSKKLPAIKFVHRPDWQKKRLGEWLDEWNLERKLHGDADSEPPPECRLFPVVGAVVGLMDTPALLSTAALAAEFVKRLASEKTPDLRGGGADEEAMRKLVRPFDRPVAVGQVRLLSPELTPDTDRPVFVAVFGDWDEGEVLMAPFSPFSVPATAGEWLTGRTTPVLRVLEIWNARSVPTAALAESWLADDLTHAECKGAWHVFEHEALGKPLAPEFEQEVGPPLVHPEDPRRRYQHEEVAALAMFQAVAERLQESPTAASAPNETPEANKIYDIWSTQDALGDSSEEKVALAASELPERERVDDLLTGFLGEARGDDCEPSKGSTLRLAKPGLESPRPAEVAADRVIVKWPTGETKPQSFTHCSGFWFVEIQLPLPWPKMVSLLREKKIRIEFAPLE